MSNQRFSWQNRQSMPVFFIVLAFTLSWLGAVAANIMLGAWAQGDPWRNYLVTAPAT